MGVYSKLTIWRGDDNENTKSSMVRLSYRVVAFIARIGRAHIGIYG